VKTEPVVKALAPAPIRPRGRGGKHLKRDEIHIWLVGRGVVPTRLVRAEFKGATQHLKALEKEGTVAFDSVEVLRDPFFGEIVARDTPPTLNAAQQAAVRAVVDARGFNGFLLQGITGSGKTEVYLHAIEAVLERGGGALVLVPEIALTPQLVTRFRARLGDQIAVLHSGLAKGARFDQWRRLRRGEVKIAIGARSALFAPVANLQLIVVDEEHDPSFKQHDGVRYHARDMALVRGNQAGAVVLLGSATPSLESCHNAQAGKLKRLMLPARATGGTLPEVHLVDLRTHRPPDPNVPFLSEPLRDALTETLARQEQAILFLNRRGFSTYVLCRSCGHVMQCPHCAISMTWHRHRQQLVCHYCDYTQRMPKHCPECKSERTIELLGQGTERVEDALATLFPHARIARMDRDTASGRKLQGLVNRMRRREIDILVGTQMVTKGHDFPDVTLVGVLAADASLQFPDFRADERTFQLLTQVAGRAGRAQKPGRVFVQTYNPEHPVLQAVQTHDYAAFAQTSLSDRNLQGYPPFTRCASIRIDGENPHAVQRVAQQIGSHLQGGLKGTPVRLRGPAPMPIAMLRNRFRFAMLLTSPERGILHRALARVPDIKPPHGVRVVVDVDAYDFL
jgi:primosomal protein N' (replication factor Y)